MLRTPVAREQAAGIDLYWLPLGAGGRSVRLNGLVFEAVVARVERRAACDLYHSALVVQLPEAQFVIEMAPIPPPGGPSRGVVTEGPVGSRWARRLRIFRYEVRCWSGGVIPDVGEAIESPRRLTDEPSDARRALEVVRELPAPVWGRDELAAGEGWNSNSVISWVVASAGLDAESIEPPVGGRAPGWRAGVIVAGREGRSRAGGSAWQRRS